jgi:hypothetical protein
VGRPSQFAARFSYYSRTDRSKALCIEPLDSLLLHCRLMGPHCCTKPSQPLGHAYAAEIFRRGMIARSVRGILLCMPSQPVRVR